MANDTSKVKLPHKVVTSIINKAKDTSCSTRQPRPR